MDVLLDPELVLELVDSPAQGCDLRLIGHDVKSSCLAELPAASTRPSVRGSYTGCAGQRSAFPSVAGSRKIATMRKAPRQPLRGSPGQVSRTDEQFHD